MQLYPRAMAGFRDFLHAAMGPELRSSLLDLQPGTAASQEALFPFFALHVLDTHMEEVRAYRELVQQSDLRAPHLW
jgi:hypothetical protein